MTDNIVKIMVIGDIGVGKTSLVRRYVDREYSPDYKISVQLDFKPLNIPNIAQAEAPRQSPAAAPAPARAASGEGDCEERGEEKGGGRAGDGEGRQGDS